MILCFARSAGSRARGRSCAQGIVVAVAFCMAAAAGGARAAETAADVSARLLLDQLTERQMPDVTLWVLDRVAADPQASPELKKEVPFRRAIALVGLGRTEADSKKRAAQFDEAEKQIDEFLKTGPTGGRAIDAYTQKGNLLIERGRAKLEQAKRPGVDAKPIKAEAAKFFDAAIKSLQGTVKPGEDIKAIVNAEDAVIKEFRDVRQGIADIKAKDPKPKEGAKAPKVVRRPAAVEKELERLEEEEAALQVKLVQTRLMVAGAYFEKSKAFDPGGEEWKKALEESTRRFKELADKYPTKGGGVLARYYEGRNVALQGLTEYAALAGPDPAKADPKKVEPAVTKIDKASTTLAELTMLEERAPLAVMLRAKALGTSLECWLARKQFDKFDASMRKFALTAAKDLPGKKLDDDWLALKYRAAVLLDRAATSPDVKDKTAIKVMQREALRLATEVAAADKDFAAEARELAAKLGKELPDAAGEKTFEAVVAEAKVALTTMQEQQAAAKKLQAEGKDAAAAAAKADEARSAALAKFDEALAFADKEGEPDPAVTDAALNYARYMRTYLLYDGKRYAEAGDLGTLLVEQFPNAMGSRQAGMIAMASLQQLARAPDAAAAQAAKKKLQGLATSIARIWPSEKEGGEALGILVNAAIESRNAKAIIELVDALPPDAGGRSLLLGRAGAALWREVLEQGRADAAGRVPPETVAAWKKKARACLDEALQGPPGTGTALKATAAAALARAQIALDDGDPATAVKILEAPGYGPWTLANDPKADPSLRGGTFAEASLTVSLRSFILAQSLDKAQQAMDRLEALAGEGADKSDRLTAMYYSMGRELQEQLERLGSGESAGTPAAAQQAAGILGGFEKFLDGLAKRDPRVSSQIWVATTYLSLGSGKGTGAVVPKAKAEQYLDRAAGVYAGLLEKKDDPDVAKYEPSIRLKIANILRERGKWDDAQGHIDWILSDSKRQNSLETQRQAAELLQQAGLALAETDAAKAETLLRAATAGRTADATVIWGWGGIANKLSRAAFAGSDEKALDARRQFFDARWNVAACLLARAQLPGKSGDAAKEALGKAETAIAMTRKLYPDLGGEATAARFEKLLKDVQKLQGSATPRGFAELDEQNAAPAEVN